MDLTIYVVCGMVIGILGWESQQRRSDFPLLGGLIGVSDLSIKQVSLNRGSTVQLPITKRGLLIYGVSNTFNGAVSVVLNQKSKKELSFISNDNTGFLSLSKDSNTGNINVTYKNNDYDVTLYYRFIAIE